MTKLQARAARIKLMAFDIDGVMTDGRLYYTEDGKEIKAFCTLDGQGLRLLQQAGIEQAIITGRVSGAVAARARDLEIPHLFQGVADKHACMRALLEQLRLSWESAGYMGDDLIDLPVLRAVGFAAAPANAHARVLAETAEAGFVTTAKGGEGAVREVCDFILAAQGAREAP
ncbi:MAG: phenylphosphate carboxylase subunit delta [Zoogloeaceae bacterium]|jgi:3-deoxy-D-manno-octulosonate 8-phosphate phosphatase (KDO 8-P phosphatase)|nr:phenylphosphate carboxylase subunit delta [Zoogloeaceae bacterium]